MRLFICEKPSQAADIAKHVGARQSGNGCRTGDGVTVTWCIGHLLEQSPPEHYNPELKTWSIDHLPVLPETWHMDVKSATKSQFTVVSRLLKSATEVVIATDADREGEVIAREVMQLCGYRGPVKRLWLGALDDASIRKALAKMLPGEKTRPLYESGLGRARADWLAGMNLTMALTKAFGGGGKGGVVHCGRVQTPVLGLVVRRERLIRGFVPKPYFVLKTLWEISGSPVPMSWQANSDKLDKDGHCVDEAYIRSVAQKISSKVGRLVSVERDDKHELAPLLYSLGSLQKEASARYGMGAKAVLDLAQALYEKHKATTYPRTDCEYLPMSMLAEASHVCDAIKKADPQISGLLAKADLTEGSRVFNDKKITAHHAIIPTMNTAVRMADMSANERLIYDLIRRRYIAQFLGAYKYQETRIQGNCESELFGATGRVPLVQGWKLAYLDLQEAAAKTKSKEKATDDGEEAQKDLALPSVQVGLQMINRKAEVSKTQTQPPKRYTEGTLIAAMESIDKEIDDPRLKKVMQNKEKAGIGTDATRGATLDGLFKRGYFDKSGKFIVPTDRGEQLIEVVEQAVPHMADPVLTALWEDHLSKVEDGSLPLATFEAQLGTWLKGQIEKIKQMGASNHKPPALQGERSSAGGKSPAQKPMEASKAAHACPACGKAMRLRQGASGAFWGCTGYPDCKITLPDDNGNPGVKQSQSFARPRPVQSAASSGRVALAIPGSSDGASSIPAGANMKPADSPTPAGGASRTRVQTHIASTVESSDPKEHLQHAHFNQVDQSVTEPTLAQSSTKAAHDKQPGVAALTPGQPLAKLVAQRALPTEEDVQRQVWAKDTTEQLVAALTSYGFIAKVVATRPTPNGAIIRFAGSDKLRVEDIENKRTQLLTTHAIELVTVQPRPGEVAVTVAGIKREPISMWELWQRRKLNRNTAGINTSFLLGVQEITGSLLYLNLGSDFEGQSVHEPHTLIAGTTGSGKSVLIQTLMLDIAASNSPELAQITLIDPKMGVDYLALADLPHMRAEVIIDKIKAAEALESLVQEMEDRYRKFAQAKARDLAAYNAKASSQVLPMLFLVHDEFADWMLDKDYADAVGAAVQRLGVKARAAGIHLVFCAQRPDKDVMPMQLRENLGNRLALKVSSNATSRIVLDQSGAEQLLGRGHMAARLSGDGLVIAQAPFMSDNEVESAVAAITAGWKPYE